MINGPHPNPCTLLAEQFQQVAQSANYRKVDSRTTDLKKWRQVLAQFIPIVLRECRNYADAGKYECQISLSKLLRASQHSAAFPETKVLCWQCQRAEQPMTSPILRGCWFNDQADDALNPPTTFDFDVTHFVTALYPVVVREIEMHGFTVKKFTKSFNMGCPHLRLFTSAKEATDTLLISWRTDPEADGEAEEGAVRRRTPAPLPEQSCPGNLMMTCGICQEEKPMQTIVPCGHLICHSCWDSAGMSTGVCPFCRGHVFNVNPLFVP